VISTAGIIDITNSRKASRRQFECGA